MKTGMKKTGVYLRPRDFSALSNGIRAMNGAEYEGQRQALCAKYGVSERCDILRRSGEFVEVRRVHHNDVLALLDRAIEANTE